MIVAPVAVDNTAGGTLLLSASNAAKCKAVIVQNPSSGATVALKFDGTADALTFANGLILAPGQERVIETRGGASEVDFHNDIKAIADAALPSTLRVHGIE